MCDSHDECPGNLPLPDKYYSDQKPGEEEGFDDLHRKHSLTQR